MKRFYLIFAATVVFIGFLGTAVRTARADATREVHITAKRFGFSPAEVTLKKGETVKLLVTSEDVVHGLYVKPLKIDTDIQPGKTAELTVTPQQAGRFTAICDHFCGVGHGNMKLTFIVTE